MRSFNLTAEADLQLGAKRAYLILEIYDLQEAFHSKSNSVLTGNNLLDAHASNTDGFHSSDSWNLAE
jgi:hypothetical protein